jgi:hypothetical protein
MDINPKLLNALGAIESLIRLNQRGGRKMSLDECRAICFVAMPFGKKPDKATGLEIDFDRIYNWAIKPAIEIVGLEPLRADEERTGGIIHLTMFARLLLSEFVIADLTLANPNVFYELGVRHATRPYTTIPIYAHLHPMPFDVAMIRAIGYNLDNGLISTENAELLKAQLASCLQDAINGPPYKDSPLYQLIPKYPVIDLPHEITDAFRERVIHDRLFQEMLSNAKSKPSNEERRLAFLQLKDQLGDPKKVQANILLDLMLSFRGVEAWDEIVKLIESFPENLKDNSMVRQQRALALNRRNNPGDRDKAISLLEGLIKDQGPDPETLGILGRVHKDRYKEAAKRGSLSASSALDDAISTYIKGFESDPRDYYPGINALTLLLIKGDIDSQNKLKELFPLVSFAVARRGGSSSNNYWDLATVLELATIINDWTSASHVISRVLDKAKESWMLKTTIENLIMIRGAMLKQGLALNKIDEMIGSLQRCAHELETKLFN